MSTYSEYFLNSNSNVVQLELIEISHSDFSQVYRIVRNATEGVTVTLEDLSEETFDYYPLRIERSGEESDLDSGLQIILGDLGELVQQELDNVIENDGFEELPVITYRTYRSDDLTTPLFGPFKFEVVNFSFDRKGVTFEAEAPSVNINKTGELYKIDRFPMLVGFL